MIILYNSIMIVTSDDPCYFPFSVNLQRSYSGKRTVYKKGKNGKSHKHEIKFNETFSVFEKDENNNLIIPVGCYEYLSKYFVNSNVVDKRVNKLFSNIDVYKIDFEKYRKCFGNFNLRDEQLLAVKKMIFSKRCIIQSPTGSGKSAIMFCFIKILSDYNNGTIPTTVIFEPTVFLVNSMLKTFNDNGIKSVPYNENRRIVDNCVNICHPSSLNNDLDKNPRLLDNVVVRMNDECHHLQSLQYLKSSRFSNFVEYSIGVSASVISKDHVRETELMNFSDNEIKIIGATGKIVFYSSPEYQINKGYLSKPILLMMHNDANESIEEGQEQNWHKIVNNVLMSDNRTRITCECSKFFVENNRKVLILVSTIKWARLLLNSFDNMGIANVVRGSYGSGRFEKIVDGKLMNDEDDIMSDFNSENNSIKVIIGTSHLYEGADIDKLDVIILAFGGMKDRMHLQGIGRALRKSKNGKYAYIVDFDDCENGILKNQSNIRMKRYNELIGITDDRKFINVETDELEGIFNKLEN